MRMITDGRVLHDFARTIIIPRTALPVISWDEGFFRERLSAQFFAFESALGGARFDSVLDIGCGLAAFDAYLAARCGARHIHLIDGTGIGCKVHGYTETAPAPWGDVRLGVRMVQANAPTAIVTPHAPTILARIPSVDLVASLRSCGHHYPVSSYLSLVRRCLRPGGALLIDLRRGTTGHSVLEAHGFIHVATVPDHSSKCTREVFYAP